MDVKNMDTDQEKLIECITAMKNSGYGMLSFGLLLFFIDLSNAFLQNPMMKNLPPTMLAVYMAGSGIFLLIKGRMAIKLSKQLTTTKCAKEGVDGENSTR